MRVVVKRGLLGAAALALVAGAADYGSYWLKAGRYLESTDDAYLKADYTTVAPKVSGYIAEVLVDDNQAVAAGQVLARIDDRDFRTALDQAQAQVTAAEATIASLDAQLALQPAVIAQAGAEIASSEAAVRFAQQDDARYQELARSGAATQQRLQQADTAQRQQTALLERSRAALTAANRQVEVIRAQRAAAVTELARARAAEHQAELNLDYTTIRAAIGGTVGARSVRVGQFVQAGTQLMAVVPLDQVYVVANFKETQLAHLENGERATIRIDGFAGAAIRGRVDSLSPASGLEFALLPPDNATGNFTKIVQRIPVKITLDADDPLRGRLRPGMSVEATIDTRPEVVAERQAPDQLARR